MKSGPLILITASTQERDGGFEDLSLRLAQKYALATRAAGGAPWVLPVIPDPDYVDGMVAQSQGVMLTGGDDVNPRLYCRRLGKGLPRTLHTEASVRDYVELLVIQAVLRRRKPLLAICRGHQLLNVALGGTLVVDINTQMPQALNHNRARLKNRPVHRVELEPGSRLAAIVRKDHMEVNSTHHQAVARLAPPLWATARSADGIIEAMELRREAAGLLPYLMSVQFHPERLYVRQDAHLKIFQDFVKGCRRLT